MKQIIISIAILTIFSANGLSQSERKHVRQGNKQFEKSAYTEAEVQYRKALEEESSFAPANFNIGAALYKQDKYEEAADNFNMIAQMETSDELKAKAYHNLGNAHLQNKKYKESIEAYKQALRLNPGDMETKYNLAYANTKLQQQEQQQQSQDQDQDQDQNKDQDQNQKQDEQEKSDQQEQEQQQNEGENEQQQNDQQPQPREISKEDAERILQALQNKEKELQEDLKKKEARSQRVQTEIDW